MKLLVQGAKTFSDVPGLEQAKDKLDIVFAPDGDTLNRELPGSDILFGWDFRGRELAQHWAQANQLKWIHWCGAGVDAALFPELVSSDTVLTNSRGTFDRAMAEYVATYMLAEVKDFRQTLQFQKKNQWAYRVVAKLSGQKAAVVGVGSIGTEIAKLLKALGVTVTGLGRSARDGDPVFGTILASADYAKIVGDVDWVIAILPATAETIDFFDAEFFSKMSSTSRFINIGRGNAVQEPALIAALDSGRIAGAMLDVFQEEPLTPQNPIWDARNIVISPHMSGDTTEFHTDMVKLFLSNLNRYLSGKPLENIADKQLGFVPK